MGTVTERHGSGILVPGHGGSLAPTSASRLLLPESRVIQTYSQPLSDWVAAARYEDLPAAVVEHTRLRILDVFGLVLAGLATPFGRSVREAVLALNPGGPSRILGSGDRTSPGGAALANGGLSQALEFDDTHNESIVHMSSPAVAAAIALAEARS